MQIKQLVLCVASPNSEPAIRSDFLAKLEAKWHDRPVVRREQIAGTILNLILSQCMFSRYGVSATELLVIPCYP